MIKLQSAVSELNESHLPPTYVPDKVPSVTLSPTPFPVSDIKSFTFQLPKLPHTVGFHLLDDDAYNLPYISAVTPGSLASLRIQPPYRTNSFILSINNQSPITSGFVTALVKAIQQSPDRMMTIDLVPRGHADHQTSYERNRAFFDQIPSLMLTRPCITSLDQSLLDSSDRITQFVVSPTKPPKPKHWSDAMNGPFKYNWIEAAKVQFDKNKRSAAYSLPFPRDDLPKDTKVLQNLLICEVKRTNTPTIWELKVRECTVGTNQERGIDFEESYCPTSEPLSIKSALAVAAA